MATPNPKRLYQVWKGNNKFFCGGRLIFGPEIASLFLTTLLIAGPSVALCSQIIAKVHNCENSKKINSPNPILGVPVLIMALIVTVLDLIFLFLTSGRDPGIIPRNAHPPDSVETLDAATPSMEWINGRTPHLKVRRTKEILVNGHAVKVKYCDTCLMYRPPRASHCSTCNNCVQRFDHHCPWIGQCIGLRNYRFFFLFISTSTFLCVYVFTFSWLNILREKKPDGSLRKAMKSEFVSVILIAYSFISVWFVGGLTVFHSYLISKNQTTYETFRYVYDKKGNPYNKGILGNFVELFVSKIPPSMNDFRSWVLDDIEIGSVTPTTGEDTISPKEKIDIDFVSKLPSGSNMLIPSTSQKLDYSAIESISICNDRNKDNTDDPPASLPHQEPIVEGRSHLNESRNRDNTDDPPASLPHQELIIVEGGSDLNENSTGADGTVVDGRACKEISNSNVTSLPIDLDIQM